MTLKEFMRLACSVWRVRLDLPEGISKIYTIENFHEYRLMLECFGDMKVLAFTALSEGELAIICSL